MTTKILITGQINGNYNLLSVIGNFKELKKTEFHGFELEFNSKKEAIKSIREAYNSLKHDEPQTKIKVNKNRTELYYDSSKAIIIY